MTSENPLSPIIEILRKTIEDPSLRKRHFAEDHDKWSKFCVAMDNLEDCDLAISFFLSAGTGESEGEQYLRLYGVLQAAFIQQDSIKALWAIIYEEDIEIPLPHSWHLVRRIRNHVAGHPIEVKWDRECPKIKRRTFVNRIDLKNGKLTLITDEDSGGTDHWNCDLRSTVLDYLKEACPFLQSLHEEIQKKWFGNVGNSHWLRPFYWN